MNYSKKSDVFSFGVMIWELLEEATPFKGIDLKVLIQEIVHDGTRLEIRRQWDPRIQSLLRRCWQTEPKERPNMSEINSIFSNINSISV